MENHSRRIAHTETHDPHTHPHHESSDSVFSGFFYEAVVQHVTTDFCRVCAALQPVKYLGNAGRSLIFVLGFSVRLLLFHCMFAGRHSNSTPDSRRLRLCSRLPCGSHSAGCSTTVVCSRELVSCGNGVSLCCS